MARGHCPDCGGLIGISPTGQPIQESSSRWWRLDMHRGLQWPQDADRCGPPMQGVCDGSGKKI